MVKLFIESNSFETFEFTYPNSLSSKRFDKISQEGKLYAEFNSFNKSIKKGDSTTRNGTPQQTKNLIKALSIRSTRP